LPFVSLRQACGGAGVYTSAIWVFPIAAVVIGERLTMRRLAAVVLGTAGLLVLVMPWDERLARSTGTGIVLLVVTAFAIAVTTAHVRAHRWVASPWQLMPWALALAAVPVLVVAWVTEGAPRFDGGVGSAAIIVYEVVVASSFGLWGLLTVTRALPAITTSILLMGIPVVGLGAAVLAGRDALGWSLIVGSALVIAGVLTGVSGRSSAGSIAAL
jgi:drug/metabolite transporter (DMT)-like permease